MRHSTLTVLILLAAIALIGFMVPSFLMLLFGAALCAVAIRAAAEAISRYTPLGMGLSIVAVLVGAVVLFGLICWLGAASFAAQAESFQQTFPNVVKQARTMLDGLPGAGWINQHVKLENIVPSPENAANIAAAGLGGTFGAIGNVVLVLLLGIYLAADPTRYRAGFLALLSPRLRPNGEAVMNAMAKSLRGWLLGQLFAMVFTGVCIFLGLWIMGVQLAAMLGLVAGLMSFIPYIGSIIAGVLVVLFTLTQEPSLVPWVIVLYVIVLNLEGNVLTPMIQQHAADVPPALLLAVQALLGTLIGVAGILVAAPLGAAVMAAIRVGYVEFWVEGKEGDDGEEKKLSSSSTVPRA